MENEKDIEKLTEEELNFIYSDDRKLTSLTERYAFNFPNSDYRKKLFDRIEKYKYGNNEK